MDSSAFDIAAAVQAGSLDPIEVVESCLARIDERDGDINGFICILRDHALKRAKSLKAKQQAGELLGPLAGAPIAIKDNLCLPGAPTTCASNMLKPYTPPYAAHAVQRVLDAGAILVGKTNMDEFAMGSSTEHSAFGVTRNPHDVTRVPGGSSGGSAAVVAAGMVPLALGSDTGGSIRQPASFCGVVGLKPSYGRVSRYGLVAYGSSLDQIGPLANTVRDAALLLQVIAGHDERDSTCANEPVPDYLASWDAPPKPLRVGVPAEYFGEGLQDDVRDRVQAGIDLLREKGADVQEVHLPLTRQAIAAYYVIAMAEASSNLARYDAVHYGHRTASANDIIELASASRGEAFGTEVKRRIMLGTYALSSGYYDAYYLKASKVRTLVRRDFAKAFEAVDVIASPVAPTTAFKFGAMADDPLAMYLADVYTVAANLAGICGISLPCGRDGDDLPIGMQLMGPHLGEEKLLRAARLFELVAAGSNS